MVDMKDSRGIHSKDGRIGFHREITLLDSVDPIGTFD